MFEDADRRVAWPSVTVTIPVHYRGLATIGFAALLVVLSTIPGRRQAGDSLFVWLVVVTPPMLQKLLHVASYAMFAFLIAWTLENLASRPARIALAFAIAVVMGGCLEWIQIHIPGRFGTLADTLLNSGGALLGAAAALLLL